MEVWTIIWVWWGKTFRTCSIAVRFALKSEVDMLKMWVHERPCTAENNPTNHYQTKFWYLAMITKTVKCNFSVSCFITSHSSIWITNDCIHCSLASQYQNWQKVGYDIVIFNGNVLGHAWHTWCKLTLEQWAFEYMDYLFLIRTVGTHLRTLNVRIWLA